MRIFPLRAFFVVSGLVLVMGVSACGSTTSTGSTASTPTTAPTTAPTPTPTTASAFTVQTAQATVSGKTTTILTNAQGLTLYYFTPDGDSAAGQTSGEGLFGKWFVATPDLAKNKP